MSPEMGWGALRDPVPWGTPAAGLPRAPRACLEKPAGWNGMAEGRGATRGGGASAPAVPSTLSPLDTFHHPLPGRCPAQEVRFQLRGRERPPHIPPEAAPFATSRPLPVLSPPFPFSPSYPQPFSPSPCYQPHSLPFTLESFISSLGNFITHFLA